MSPNLRRMLLASALYLVNSGIGTAMAIRYHLPADLAGVITGRNPRSDFLVWPGTALGPPGPLVLLHLLFMALAPLPGRAGKVGTTGLTLNGAGFTLGMLGERITWRVLHPRTFDPPIAAVVAGNIALPIAIVLFGIRALQRREPFGSGQDKSSGSEFRFGGMRE
jgi:hypothetical protein